MGFEIHFTRGENFSMVKCPTIFPAPDVHLRWLAALPAIGTWLHHT